MSVAVNSMSVQQNIQEINKYDQIQALLNEHW